MLMALGHLVRYLVNLVPEAMLFPFSNDLADPYSWAVS